MAPSWRQWVDNWSANDVPKLAGVILLGALGYSQHAKSYCEGREHSLPPGSAAAAGYPCNASGLERALYCLSNLKAVYHDMFRLHARDRWVSVQLAISAFQLLAAIVLPPALFHVHISPYISQVFRLVPLVYHLFLSYAVRFPPNSAGRWYLASHPFLDLCTNLLFPVLPVVEGAYGVAALLLVTALRLRYDYLDQLSAATAAAAAAPRLCAADGSEGTTTTCADTTSAASYALAYNTALHLSLCILCTLGSLGVEFARGLPAQRRRNALLAAAAADKVHTGGPGADECGASACAPYYGGTSSTSGGRDGLGQALPRGHAVHRVGGASGASGPRGSGLASVSGLSFRPSAAAAAAGAGEAHGQGAPARSAASAPRGAHAHGRGAAGASGVAAPGPVDTVINTTNDSRDGKDSSNRAGSAMDSKPCGPQEDDANLAPFLDAADSATASSALSAARSHLARLRLPDCCRDRHATTEGTTGVQLRAAVQPTCTPAAPFSFPPAAAPTAAGTTPAFRLPGPDGLPPKPSSPHSAAPAVAQPASVRLLYTPRVRLTSTHLKIHGADPRDLPPDYEQRLADVVRASGRELLGVYVRAGCIELVLDSTGWAEDAEEQQLQQLPAPPGGPQGQQPDTAAAGPSGGAVLPPAGPSTPAGGVCDEAGHGSGSGGLGSGGGAARCSPTGSDVDLGAVIRALNLSRSDGSSSEDGLFGEEMLLLEPVDADPPELSEAGQLPHGQLGGAASFRSVGARQQQGRVPDDERMRLGQNAAADSMAFLASADELATDRSTPEGRPASSSGGFGLLSSGGAGAGGGGGGAAGAGGGGRRVRGSGGGNVSSQQSAAGGRRRNSGSNAASSYKETSSSEDRCLESSQAGSAVLTPSPPSWGASSPEMNTTHHAAASPAGPAGNSPGASGGAAFHRLASLRVGGGGGASAQPISRQALLLGSPLRPEASGIVSLHPRIITTASAAMRSNYTAFDTSGNGGSGAAARQRLPAAALASAASDATGAAARPAPHPAPHLTAVVRRYHTPSAFLQPAAVGPAGPASTTASLEFTIRARGEYLPLFSLRTNAVRASMAGLAGGGAAEAAAVASAMAATAPAASAMAVTAPAAASAIAPPLTAAAAAVEHGVGAGSGTAAPQLPAWADDLRSRGVFPGVGNEHGSSGGQSNDLRLELDGGLQLLPGIAEGQGGEGDAAAAAGVRQEVWYETYALELLEPPQNPGLLLIDARGPLEQLLPAPDPSAATGPGPAFVMSCRAVPVVAISNPAVAAELQAAVQSWDGGESELDDLLLDLGTWAHHVSMQAGMLLALAAVDGDGAVGGGGGIWGGGAAAGAATAAAAAALPAIDQRLASLGRHLLAYAEASGWAVTASALRSELMLFGLAPHAPSAPRPVVQRPPQPAPAMPPAIITQYQGTTDATAAAHPSTTTAPSEGGAGTAPAQQPAALHSRPHAAADMSSVPVPPAAAPAPQGSGPQDDVKPQPAGSSPDASAHPAGRAKGRGMVARVWSRGAADAVGGWGEGWGGGGVSPNSASLPGWGSGLSAKSSGDGGGSLGQPQGPAVLYGSEEDFRAFKAAWVGAQAWIIQVLDLVSMMALLFRGRHELLSPSNITTLVACSIGSTAAVARLFLPLPRWLALVEATKIPRHVCYCVAKGLIGLAGLEPPPGIYAYELGLPVWVFEGAIIPGSCLMSVWAAAAVGAVKVPLYVSLWGRGDPSLSLLYRVTRAIGISAMSVLTTAACHANIRRAFRGRVRRLLQQQRQQQKADDGRAVAPHSKKVD